MSLDILSYAMGLQSRGISPAEIEAAVEKYLEEHPENGYEKSENQGTYPVQNETQTTLSLVPNRFYQFGEVASLDLTLATPSDNTITNEYCFEFVSGATPTELILPSDIKWVSEPSVEANKTYQCSILNGLGVIVGA